MVKMKLLLLVNTEKYFDFLIVYTNHQNQKQYELIVLYSANFVKKDAFLIFARS